MANEWREATIDEYLEKCRQLQIRPFPRDELTAMLKEGRRLLVSDHGVAVSNSSRE